MHHHLPFPNPDNEATGCGKEIIIPFSTKVGLPRPARRIKRINADR
jgi:hypothetical protein